MLGCAAAAAAADAFDDFDGALASPRPIVLPLSQQQESLAALLADMEASTLAAATSRQALAQNNADDARDT